MKKGQERKSRDLKPYYDLSHLKGAHEGRTCIVLGAGPSVAFLNLKNVDNHVVISVNSSILLLDWDKGDPADRYWISNDVLCMQWDYFWKNVVKSKCNKIVRTSWKEHSNKLMKYDFRFFGPRDSEKSPLTNDGDKLCSVSSIPTAIDLAILTGCKDIYVLGADHRMMHGNSHFWQFWPKARWPQRTTKGKNYRPEQSHQIRKFQENFLTYESLQELADREDANIYNGSHSSTIEVFQKVPLSEVPI